jgi:hypothetical protein
MESLNPAEEMYQKEIGFAAHARAKAEEALANHLEGADNIKSREAVAAEEATKMAKQGLVTETAGFLELTVLTPEEKRDILAEAYDRKATKHDLEGKRLRDEGKPTKEIRFEFDQSEGCKRNAEILRGGNV